MHRILAAILLAILPGFCSADFGVLNYFATVPATRMDIGLLKLQIHLNSQSFGEKNASTSVHVNNPLKDSLIYITKRGHSDELIGTKEELESAELACQDLIQNWRWDAGVHNGKLVSSLRPYSAWAGYFKMLRPESNTTGIADETLLTDLDNFFTLFCTMQFRTASITVSGALVSVETITDVVTGQTYSPSLSIKEFSDLLDDSQN